MLKITNTFEDERAVTLRLDGKIDTTTITDLEALCRRYKEEGRKSVSLDFTGVTFIDYSGLGRLKKIKAKGITMMNGSPFVETLLNGVKG